MMETIKDLWEDGGAIVIDHSEEDKHEEKSAAEKENLVKEQKPQETDLVEEFVQFIRSTSQTTPETVSSEKKSHMQPQHSDSTSTGADVSQSSGSIIAHQDADKEGIPGSRHSNIADTLGRFTDKQVEPNKTVSGGSLMENSDRVRDIATQGESKQEQSNDDKDITIIEEKEADASSKKDAPICSESLAPTGIQASTSIIPVTDRVVEANQKEKAKMQILPAPVPRASQEINKTKNRDYNQYWENVLSRGRGSTFQDISCFNIPPPKPMMSTGVVSHTPEKLASVSPVVDQGLGHLISKGVSSSVSGHPNARVNPPQHFNVINGQPRNDQPAPIPNIQVASSGIHQTADNVVVRYLVPPAEHPAQTYSTTNPSSVSFAAVKQIPTASGQFVEVSKVVGNPSLGAMPSVVQKIISAQSKPPAVTVDSTVSPQPVKCNYVNGLYICETCQSQTKTRRMFYIHVWGHLHVPNGKCGHCKFPELMKGNVPICPLVMDVLTSLEKGTKTGERTNVNTVLPKNLQPIRNNYAIGAIKNSVALGNVGAINFVVPKPIPNTQQLILPKPPKEIAPGLNVASREVGISVPADKRPDNGHQPLSGRNTQTCTQKDAPEPIAIDLSVDSDEEGVLVIDEVMTVDEKNNQQEPRKGTEETPQCEEKAVTAGMNTTSETDKEEIEKEPPPAIDTQNTATVTQTENNDGLPIIAATYSLNMTDFGTKTDDTEQPMLGIEASRTSGSENDLGSQQSWEKASVHSDEDGLPDLQKEFVDVVSGDSSSERQYLLDPAQDDVDKSQHKQTILSSEKSPEVTKATEIEMPDSDDKDFVELISGKSSTSNLDAPPPPTTTAAVSSNKPPGFYQCGFIQCAFFTDDVDGFKMHMRVKHSSSLYPCAYCETICDTDDKIISHMKQHMKRMTKRVYQCFITGCKFGTDSVVAFKLHCNNLHPGMSAMCNYCRVEFKTMNELADHMAASTVKLIECPYCKLVSQSKKNLIAHISAEHPWQARKIIVSTFISCMQKRPKMLKYEPPTPAIVKEHDCKNMTNGTEAQKAVAMNPIKKNVVEEEKNLKCQHCPYKCARKSILVSHEAMHASKNFICSLCMYGGNSFQSFKSHMSAVHPDQANTRVRIYVCQLCSFQANHEIMLDQHFDNVHPTDEMRYEVVKKLLFTPQPSKEPTDTSSNNDIHPSSEVLPNDPSPAGQEVATDGSIALKPDVSKEFLSESQRFLCPLCLFNTESIKAFRRHMAHQHRSHQGSKSFVTLYSCKSCRYSSTQREVIENHTKWQHPSHAVSIFSNPLYVGHLPANQSTGKDPSDNSPQSEMNSLLQESGISVIDKYQCEICKFNANSRESLSQHMVRHNTPKSSKKKTRPDPSKDQDKLVENQDYFTISIKRPVYQCHICEHYKSRAEPVLFSHLAFQHRVSHGEYGFHYSSCEEVATLYRCKRCNVQVNYQSKGMLAHHFKGKHPEFFENRPDGKDKMHVDPVPAKPPAVETATSSSATDDVDQVFCLPQESVFKMEIACPMCEFKSKVRYNLLRHFTKAHKMEKNSNGQWVIPTQDEKMNALQVVSVASKDDKNDEDVDNLQLMTNSNEAVEKETCQWKLVDKNLYQCLLCSFQNKRPNKMKRHYDYVHAGFKPYHCVHCNYSSAESAKVARHCKNQHPTKVCRIFRFSDDASHSESKGMSVFMCFHCRFQSTTLEYVAKHSENAHAGEPIKILQGYEVVPNEDPMHLEETQPQIGFLASDSVQCGFKRVEPYLLQCDLCSYQSEYITAMKRHVLTIHYKIKPFMCGYCKWSHAEKFMLLRHMQNSHKDKPLATIRVDFKEVAKGQVFQIVAETQGPSEFENVLSNADLSQIGNTQTTMPIKSDPEDSPLSEDPIEPPSAEGTINDSESNTVETHGGDLQSSAETLSNENVVDQTPSVPDFGIKDSLIKIKAEPQDLEQWNGNKDVVESLQNYAGGTHTTESKGENVALRQVKIFRCLYCDYYSFYNRTHVVRHTRTWHLDLLMGLEHGTEETKVCDQQKKEKTMEEEQQQKDSNTFERDETMTLNSEDALKDNDMSSGQKKDKETSNVDPLSGEKTEEKQKKTENSATSDISTTASETQPDDQRRLSSQKECETAVTEFSSQKEPLTAVDGLHNQSDLESPVETPQKLTDSVAALPSLQQEIVEHMHAESENDSSLPPKLVMEVSDSPMTELPKTDEDNKDGDLPQLLTSTNLDGLQSEQAESGAYRKEGAVDVLGKTTSCAGADKTQETPDTNAEIDRQLSLTYPSGADCKTSQPTAEKDHLSTEEINHSVSGHANMEAMIGTEIQVCDTKLDSSEYSSKPNMNSAVPHSESSNTENSENVSDVGPGQDGTEKEIVKDTKLFGSETQSTASFMEHLGASEGELTDAAVHEPNLDLKQGQTTEQKPGEEIILEIIDAVITSAVEHCEGKRKDYCGTTEVVKGGEDCQQIQGGDGPSIGDIGDKSVDEAAKRSIPTCQICGYASPEKNSMINHLEKHLPTMYKIEYISKSPGKDISARELLSQMPEACLEASPRRRKSANMRASSPRSTSKQKYHAPRKDVSKPHFYCMFCPYGTKHTKSDVTKHTRAHHMEYLMGLRSSPAKVEQSSKECPSLEDENQLNTSITIRDPDSNEETSGTTNKQQEIEATDIEKKDLSNDASPNNTNSKMIEQNPEVLHNEKKNNKNTCRLCGFSSKSISNIKSHIARHLPELTSLSPFDSDSITAPLFDLSALEKGSNEDVTDGNVDSNDGTKAFSDGVNPVTPEHPRSFLPVSQTTMSTPGFWKGKVAKCPYCEYQSGFRHNTMRHVRTKHMFAIMGFPELDSILTCSLSDVEKKDKMVKEGMERAHLPICSICKYTTSAPALMRRHITLTHIPVLFEIVDTGSQLRTNKVKGEILDQDPSVTEESINSTRLSPRVSEACRTPTSSGTVSGKKVFKCVHCEYRSNYGRIDVLRHSLKHHCEQLMSGCSPAGESVATEAKDVDMNVESVPTPTFQKCRICDYVAHNKDTMYLHFKEEHIQSLYAVEGTSLGEDSDKTMSPTVVSPSTSRESRQKLKQNSPKSPGWRIFRCMYCDYYSFYGRIDVVRHTQHIHMSFLMGIPEHNAMDGEDAVEKNELTCQVCMVSLEDKAIMREHIQKEHLMSLYIVENGEKTLRLKKTSGFTSPSKRRKPVISPGKSQLTSIGKAYKCLFCGFTCLSCSSNLYRHILSKHFSRVAEKQTTLVQTSEIPPNASREHVSYKCKHCDAILGSKMQVRYHLKHHQGAFYKLIKSARKSGRYTHFEGPGSSLLKPSGEIEPGSSIKCEPENQPQDDILRETKSLSPKAEGFVTVDQDERKEHTIWACADCEFTSTSNRNVSRHRKSFHPKGISGVNQSEWISANCPFCSHCAGGGKLPYEKRNEYMRNHIKKAHMEGGPDDTKALFKRTKDTDNFECLVCGHSTPANRGIVRIISHLKVAHPQLSNVLYKCMFCQYSRRQLRLMKVHMKSKHHGKALRFLKITGPCGIQNTKSATPGGTSDSAARPDLLSEGGHVANEKESPKRRVVQVDNINAVLLLGKGQWSKDSTNKSHICPVCSKWFSNHNSLYKHCKRHSSFRPFKCGYCKFNAFSRYSIRLHSKNMHKGREVKIKQLREPPKVQLKRGSISSEASTPASTPSPQIKEDIKPEKLLYCTMCPYTTKSNENLKEHKLIHYNHRPYTCGHCSYRGRTLEAAKKHHSENHPSMPPEISYVKTALLSKLADELKNNQEIEEPQVEEKDTAPVSEPSETRAGVRVTRHEDGMYHCHLCDFKSDYHGSVGRHVMHVHPENSPRTSGVTSAQRRPSNSDASRTYSANLQASNRRLSDTDVTRTNQGNSGSLKPPHRIPSNSDVNSVKSDSDDTASKSAGYNCMLCKESFSRIDCARLHVMKHLLYYPMRCSECDHKFQTTIGINNHIQKQHRGNGTVVFEQDPQKEEMVKNHIEETHGKRSNSSYIYACRRCPHTSTRRENFKSHIQQHFGYKPYSCGICKVVFCTKANAEKHVAKLHKGAEIDVIMKKNSSKWKEVLDEVSKCKVLEANAFPGKESASLKPKNSGATVGLPLGVKPFGCKICGYKTRKGSKLKAHKAGHGKTAVYQCAYCSERHDKFGIIKEHLEAIHPQMTCAVRVTTAKKPAQTGNGSKQAMNNQTAQRKSHSVAVSSSVEDSSSDSSEEDSGSEGSLETVQSVSMTTKVDDGSRGKKSLEERSPSKRHHPYYYCTECPVRIRSDHIQYHVNRCHLKYEPYICLLCNATTCTKPLMHIHYKQKHQGEEPKFNHVKNSQKEKSMLKLMQAIKAGTRIEVEIGSARLEYFCQICAYSVKRMDALRLHYMSSHLNYKPLSCGYCNKEASAEGLLERHCERAHPGQKKLIQGKKNKDIETLLDELMENATAPRSIASDSKRKVVAQTMLNIANAIENEPENLMHTSSPIESADCETSKKRKQPVEVKLEMPPTKKIKIDGGRKDHAYNKAKTSDREKTPQPQMQNQSRKRPRPEDDGMESQAPTAKIIKTEPVDFQNAPSLSSDSPVEISFLNNYKIALPFTTNGSSRQYHCPLKLCTYTTSALGHMKHHAWVHYGGKYVCNICGLVNTQKPKVRHHIQEDHFGLDVDENIIVRNPKVTDLNYCCHVCSFTTRDKTSFLEHYLTVHCMRGQYHQNTSFNLNIALKDCMQEYVEQYGHNAPGSLSILSEDDEVESLSIDVGQAIGDFLQEQGLDDEEEDEDVDIATSIVNSKRVQPSISKKKPPQSKFPVQLKFKKPAPKSKSAVRKNVCKKNTGAGLAQAKRSHRNLFEDICTVDTTSVSRGLHTSNDENGELLRKFLKPKSPTKASLNKIKSEPIDDYPFESQDMPSSSNLKDIPGQVRIKTEPSSDSQEDCSLDESADWLVIDEVD